MFGHLFFPPHTSEGPSPKLTFGHRSTREEQELGRQQRAMHDEAARHYLPPPLSLAIPKPPGNEVGDD